MSVVKGLPKDGTAGEIRQVLMNGVSETGLYSTEFVRNKVIADPYVYLSKSEPGGKVMKHVEEVTLNLGEAAQAIIKAGANVRNTADKTIEDIVGHNRKLRDNNTKLTDSINVFLKTATKPEYLKAINDVERLSLALEKIADLEKAGILNKLAAVIK